MQTEKAFQKQDAVFIGRVAKGKKSKGPQRYYRSVGLGFKTPKAAIEVRLQTRGLLLGGAAAATFAVAAFAALLAAV